MGLLKKINIGLDIGVSSVGWSIIDEDYEIIDMGVRLFDDAANPKDGTLDNQKRRSMRSLRRMLRRTKLRKKDLINFLVLNKLGTEDQIKNIIEKFDITKHGINFIHPAQLKVKALEEKITKEELIFILFHYIHHRGYFYITEKDLENTKNDKKSKINEKIITNLYPSQQMVEFYKKNNYFEYKSINYEQFSNLDWVKEIKAILKKQGCSNNFIDNYLEIFKRVRKFEEGPGNENSPSNYGLWRKKYDKKLKKWIITNKIDGNKEAKKLWDYTVGKCTWLPDEQRDFKNSPVAELFNLFNDINNLYFFNDHDNKLTKEDKLKIFAELSQSFIGKTINLSKKIIVKVHNANLLIQRENEKINEDDIFGYRIEKDKDKALFTKLNNFYIIGKWIKNHKKKFANLKEIDCLNIEFIKTCNVLFNKIASEQDLEERAKVLQSNDEVNKQTSLVTYLDVIRKMKNLSSTHSLSEKAMMMYIGDCIKHLDESNNQQQFYMLNKHLFPQKSTLSKNIYIKHNLLKDEIISPTAKRAFNQTILVLNKILKIYRKKYSIDNIVIELARDKNTAEAKKNIKDLQKKNKQEIIDILPENVDYVKLSKIQKTRINLWKQQEKTDIYDGDLINWHDVLTGNNLQVDHIIPMSISHDNSLNNKVLTKSSNNSEKSNRTPYQWLNSLGKFEKFKIHIEKLFGNKKINNEKRQKLLSLNDPLDNTLYFIGRHLADTRYASTLVLHKFQDFFNDNPNYNKTKVKVIRGAVTNFARFNLFIDKNNDNKSYLPKDRDLYCHHAIDAAIICFLGMQKSINNLLSYYQSCAFDKNNNKWLIDKKTKRLCDKTTGEIIDFKNIYDKEKINLFGKKLIIYNDTRNDIKKDKVHFSRGIVNKNNIAFFNETIYSCPAGNDPKKTTCIYYDKLDLVESKTKDLDKYFLDPKTKQAQSLLIYKRDRQLYEKLFKIYNDYQTSTTKIDDKKPKNPFVAYMQDNFNIEKPKWILIGQQRIKKLRIVNECETSATVFLKKHNNKALHHSLHCLYWRIYVDRKNKFIIFPINVNFFKIKINNNLTKIILDDKKIKSYLNDKFNVSDTNKYVDIKRGTILVNKENNEIFYINGADPTANKFELKWLKGKNTKRPGFTQKSDLWQVPIKTIIEKYNHAEIDPLGKIYNLKNFSEYFR